MDEIKLQEKTSALPGKIESYWFENEHVGLINTEFHSLEIPLKKFDSGLEYDSQPHETELLIDWLQLSLSDSSKLDGLNLNHENYPEAEASIYVGSAHNPCDIKELLVTEIGKNEFKVAGKLYVDFQHENVAQNESFEFSTTVVYSKRA